MLVMVSSMRYHIIPVEGINILMMLGGCLCGLWGAALLQAEEVVGYDGLKSCKCKAGYGSLTG
jgi:hypothetical protein